MKDDELLLITGTPRSGTTAFAAFMQMMGYRVYGTWVKGLMPGGLEDVQVLRINDDIRRGQIENIDNEIQDFDRRVIKDPRFVTLGNTNLIETWFTNRPNIKLLVMIRDFEQVALSMDKTTKINVLNKCHVESARILKKNYQEFIEFIRELKVPFEIIKHPAFIDEFHRISKLLVEFYNCPLDPNSEVIKSNGLVGESPEEIWNEWFDSSKVKTYI